MKKETKTADQIAAEKQEIEFLVCEINKQISKVPASVMGGSHQVAVIWKQAAQKALKAAQAKIPRVNALRDANQSLSRFQ